MNVLTRSVIFSSAQQNILAGCGVFDKTYIMIGIGGIPKQSILKPILWYRHANDVRAVSGVLGVDGDHIVHRRVGGHHDTCAIDAKSLAGHNMSLFSTDNFFGFRMRKDSASQSFDDLGQPVRYFIG